MELKLGKTTHWFKLEQTTIVYCTCIFVNSCSIFFFKMVRIFILNFRLPCNLHTMLSQNLSQWSSLKNLPFHFIHLLQCVTSSSYWGKFPEESFWLIHRLDLWLQINVVIHKATEGPKLFYKVYEIFSTYFWENLIIPDQEIVCFLHKHVNKYNLS